MCVERVCWCTESVYILFRTMHESKWCVCVRGCCPPQNASWLLQLLPLQPTVFLQAAVLPLPALFLAAAPAVVGCGHLHLAGYETPHCCRFELTTAAALWHFWQGVKLLQPAAGF